MTNKFKISRMKKGESMSLIQTNHFIRLIKLINFKIKSKEEETYHYQNRQ